MPSRGTRRLTYLVVALAAGAFVAVPAGASVDDAARPLALTSSGVVKGKRVDGVDKFQGIPYAAAPVRDLRWTAPRLPKPWLTPRDATEPGKPCPQKDNGKPLPGTSEDCLNVNVVTPAKPGARKPVMVWVHGGSNNSGTGTSYDATRLAKRGDVVVVTMDYRLAGFGFFSHPELPDSGSFGLLDQQAALRWVRTNAVFFGGDPGNVTVFGESAGGVDLCAQLTSPAARGLFDKAILQSGSCAMRIPAYPSGTDAVLDDSTFFTPLPQAEQAGVAKAADLGCAGPDTMDCLRRLPVDKLLFDVGEFGVASGTRTLPVPPRQAVKDGKVHRVPVLSGHTRDESRLVVDVIAAVTGPITTERYDRTLRSAFGADAERVRAAYPLSDHANDPALALAAVDTDRAFACPQLTTGRDLARRVPVHGYLFADRTAPTFSPFLTDLPPGASHAAELAYLFDLAIGPWGPGFQEVELTADQRELGDRMIDTWTTFARTGTPTTDGQTWPRIDPDADGVAVRPFATGSNHGELVDAWREHQCGLWSTLD